MDKYTIGIVGTRDIFNLSEEDKEKVINSFNIYLNAIICNLDKETEIVIKSMEIYGFNSYMNDILNKKYKIEYTSMSDLNNLDKRKVLFNDNKTMNQYKEIINDSDSIIFFAKNYTFNKIKELIVYSIQKDKEIIYLDNKYDFNYNKLEHGTWKTECNIEYGDNEDRNTITLKDNSMKI